MSAEPYKVDPESELGHLIDRAPLLLEKNGKRFRLVGDAEDIWAGYDPDAALASMNAAVGGIPVEEAERVTKYHIEWRS